jgi:hypothetical protein
MQNFSGSRRLIAMAIPIRNRVWAEPFEAASRRFPKVFVGSFQLKPNEGNAHSE